MLTLTTIQAPIADFFCERIAGYISEKLAIPVRCIADIPWQEREKMIDAGEAEVSWICGLPYVWKADRPASKVELLAAAVMAGERYMDKPVYFSDVVVRSDSRFKSFSDLRGCRWAYNEPNSHSGYNVVRYHLASLGYADGYFGQIVESGAHQASLEMVLDGQIDASAIDSTVLELELAQRPAMAGEIRIIEILGPSPIPPWVVSKELPQSLKSRLRASFLEMHFDDVGRAILKEGLASRFVAVSDGDYEPIREMERIGQAVKGW